MTNARHVYASSLNGKPCILASGFDAVDALDHLVKLYSAVFGPVQVFSYCSTSDTAGCRLRNGYTITVQRHSFEDAGRAAA